MRQISPWPLFGELDPASPISESFRSLRTHVRFALDRAGGQVVAVTSCLSAEGKSLTAANLAVAFAKEGRSTLLIDADLRKPVLHRAFHVNNRQGLASQTEHSGSWKPAVVPTGIDRLSLLPAGACLTEPADFLAADLFRQVLAEAREAYEAVVIDTPPLLPYADARIVAALSDGVLLVIGAGKVRRRQYEQALHQLRHVRANVLGTVVNGALPAG